ncbi:carbamoyltransferase HypF [Elusimicrobiota bacterium]
MTIKGRVQGVGFRPTAYRYALELGLAGSVSNTHDGVVVDLQGPVNKLASFETLLKEKAPPGAAIKSIEKRILAPSEKLYGFSILKSSKNQPSKTLFPPDLGLCEACSKDINNPHDRRYKYPFTNCTDCGPRFTIIENLPYDRPKTTMKGFHMCSDCLREYNDPLNRRFHAQPNACPKCGPIAEFKPLRERKNKSSLRYPFCNNNGNNTASLSLRGAAATKQSQTGINAIKKAAQLIGQGKVLAIQSLGGFHLACDAYSDKAVKRLRALKNRPHKPFAVMLTGVHTAQKHCEITSREASALESPRAPVIMLEKHHGSGLSKLISPGLNTMGIMLTYTPLHSILFKELKSCTDALVMTSGNISDEPICRTPEQALRKLNGIADAFLTHNRPIRNRCDDSVVYIHQDKCIPIRRARGYVPDPVEMRTASATPILACGAELKTTFCLTRDNEAFPSTHIGGMKDQKTTDFYEEALGRMSKFLEIKPAIIAHDTHLDYLTTRIAKQQAKKLKLPASRLIPVQHHHAHIASVMAEHKLDRKVLGIALDGTGLGTDGTIWGGEFLEVNGADFRRVAHLKPVRIPGGDIAATEIWRCALPWIEKIHLSSFPSPLRVGDAPKPWRRSGEGRVRVNKEAPLNITKNLFKDIDPKKIEFAWKMMQKGINSPLTSSMGRLFDAVAALINVRHETTYEAQAAMELESLLIPVSSFPPPGWGRLGGGGKASPSYTFKYSPSPHLPIIIDPTPAISSILTDLKSKRPSKEISLKFHVCVANMIAEISKTLCNQLKIRTVALSGGVFQNKTLLNLAIPKLKQKGLKTFTNTQVPANDAGISLGQAWIAMQKMLNAKG